MRAAATITAKAVATRKASFKKNPGVSLLNKNRALQNLVMADDRTITMTLSRWDAAGLANCLRSEAEQIVAVLTGKRTCSLYYNMHTFAHAYLPATHTGKWSRNTMTYGDVIKVYVACQVLGVDIRTSMYYICDQISPGINK